GEVLEGASEDLLTRPKGIDVGGIEEVDTQLQGFLDDRPAVVLVEHPLVNPPVRVPEPHAPQAEARHVHAGVSELRVVHVILLSFLFPSPAFTPSMRVPCAGVVSTMASSRFDDR